MQHFTIFFQKLTTKKSWTPCKSLAYATSDRGYNVTKIYGTREDGMKSRATPGTSALSIDIKTRLSPPPPLSGHCRPDSGLNRED